MTTRRLSRFAITLALLAAAAGCHSSALTPAAAAVQLSPRRQADTTLVRRDIDYLASPALEGRLTGTPGNDSAAAYIARRYGALHLDAVPRVHAIGCAHDNATLRSAGGSGASVPAASPDPFGCSSPYFEPFAARSVEAAHAGLRESLPTQNVVALLPGTDSVLRREYVVIGAHFDHLGRSSFNALDPQAGNAIRPGADDNASGTAAVMELARLFAIHPARRSIVFVNFSGEELGLLGSQFFVEHPPVPLDRVVAMLNFDMVGRMRANKLIVYGVATATELRGIVDSANTAPAFTLDAIGDGFGPSDQSSFYAKNIPVLFFFTDVHEDYHRATDVASKIDVADEGRVIDYAGRIARRLADRDGHLTFVRTGSPPQMASGPGRDVYFGSVPDMGASDVVGVRLSGVTPGSPAEVAGARAGDVIVEFAGRPVKDLYAYSDALYAHRPGDVVQFVVIRDGTRVTLTATLGTRH